MRIFKLITSVSLTLTVLNSLVSSYHMKVTMFTSDLLSCCIWYTRIILKYIFFQYSSLSVLLKNGKTGVIVSHI